jgi:hypothetical protein
MRRLVWLLFAVLVAVQQDWTGWCRAPAIVLGFLPRALAVQVGVSLTAAALWWWAVTWCWPAGLDDAAEGHVDPGSSAAAGRPRR